MTVVFLYAPSPMTPTAKSLLSLNVPTSTRLSHCPSAWRARYTSQLRWQLSTAHCGRGGPEARQGAGQGQVMRGGPQQSRHPGCNTHVV